MAFCTFIFITHSDQCYQYWQYISKQQQQSGGSSICMKYCLHPDSLGNAALSDKVAMCVRAGLSPQIVVCADADVEVDLRLGAPVDLIARVNRPARRASGAAGLQLVHVAEAGVLVEALAAALDHIAVQLAVHGLGLVLGAGTSGVCEEPLALFGVNNLELECLAGRTGNGGGVDAFGGLAAAITFSLVGGRRT